MRPVILDALFWIAVAGCAVAQFFILRAVLRTPALPSPRHEPAGHGAPADLPVRVQSGRGQEIVWAVLPSLLLGAAFVLAWRVMHPAADPAAIVLIK